MNATFGLMEGIPERIRNKQQRYERMAERSLALVRDIAAKTDN